MNFYEDTIISFEDTSGAAAAAQRKVPFEDTSGAAASAQRKVDKEASNDLSWSYKEFQTSANVLRLNGDLSAIIIPFPISQPL